MDEPTGPREPPVRVADATGRPAWGSDLVVDVLRRLEIPYAAMLPGASFRGLHDSLVNYGANTRPELLLCAQEQAAVSIAAGWARVTGRPMVAIVHNVVGLLQASMSVFDAWCDRVPLLLLGGTGPVDAVARRPWIDWIHTANVQGNLVRDFTKWDDQPASVGALPESLLRAHRIAATEPPGPVYVCLDAALQEQRLPEPLPLPDPVRYRAAEPARPAAELVQRTAELLLGAERPVVLAGRAGRDAETVRRLVRLAELLALPVVDAEECWHNFPTPHPLDFTGMEAELLAEADLVLGLDVVDFAGGLRPAGGHRPTVVHVSNDELSHRGLIADHQALPAVDLPLLASPAATLPMLLGTCQDMLHDGGRALAASRLDALSQRQEVLRQRQRAFVQRRTAGPELTETRLWVELWEVLREYDFVLVAGRPRRDAPGVLAIPGPERNVAGAGGGAVGTALPKGVGAALALRGRGRLPVAVVGDGEYVHGAQALWTAARYRIPLLVVVANNRSYHNDQAHQARVAQRRGRPVENQRIAIRLEDPAIDLAALARSFGVAGEGPLTAAEQLAPAFRRAAEAVAAGGQAVVDVRVADREAER